MSCLISLNYQDPTLHLPRILCLHGGGTNARIFRTQCRVLSAHLAPYFRLIYADAPFESQAGPDVTAIYGSYGPFKRWLRWKPEHPEIDPSVAARIIEASLDFAIKEDDKRGATGEVTGVLGFSQGAKIAASLLLRQQVRCNKLGLNNTLNDARPSGFRFGILLAGRGPLVAFDLEMLENSNLVNAGHLGFQIDIDRRKGTDHVIKVPTLHVHGLNDEGLHLHRRLLEDYCEYGERSNSRLIQWNGHHRIPIQTDVVREIVGQILRMARQTGIIIDSAKNPNYTVNVREGGGENILPTEF